MANVEFSRFLFEVDIITSNSHWPGATRRNQLGWEKAKMLMTVMMVLLVMVMVAMLLVMMEMMVA